MSFALPSRIPIATSSLDGMSDRTLHHHLKGMT